MALTLKDLVVGRAYRVRNSMSQSVADITTAWTADASKPVHSAVFVYLGHCSNPKDRDKYLKTVPHNLCDGILNKYVIVLDTAGDVRVELVGATGHYVSTDWQPLEQLDRCEL